jgi:hypothetical protein
MTQNPNLVRLVGMGIPAILALWPPPLSGAMRAATVGAYYFEGWYHDTPGAIAAFANEKGVRPLVLAFMNPFSLIATTRDDAMIVLVAPPAGSTCADERPSCGRGRGARR